MFADCWDWAVLVLGVAGWKATILCLTWGF